jgi:hypothetical protein
MNMLEMNFCISGIVHETHIACAELEIAVCDFLFFTLNQIERRSRVTLLHRMREVPGSELCLWIGCCEGFHGFPQSLQANGAQYI